MLLYSQQYQIALELFITPKGNSKPIKIILHISPLRHWPPTLSLSVYIFMILNILDSLLSRIAQNLFIDFCVLFNSRQSLQDLFYK